MKRLFIVLCFLLLGTLIQAQEATEEVAAEITETPVYEDGYKVWWFTQLVHGGMPQPIYNDNGRYVYFFEHATGFSVGSAAATWGSDELQYGAGDGTIVYFDWASHAWEGWDAVYFDDTRPPYQINPELQTLLDADPLCEDILTGSQRESWGMCGLYYQHRFLNVGDHNSSSLTPVEVASYGIHMADLGSEAVSPNGRFIAYVKTLSGSEAPHEAFLIVLDNSTGRHYLVTRGYYQAPLRWRDDNMLEASWEGFYNSSFEILKQ